MKLKSMLLTGVLVMTMSVFPAFAEESFTEVPQEAEASTDGLLEYLFGEGGPLADVLPEGTSIDEMIETAKKQLGEADQEISQVLDVIAEKAKGVAGGLSIDYVKEYAGELLGQLVGGDLGIESLESAMQDYASVRGAESQYFIDHNTGSMDFGDVQIISNCTASMENYEEAEEFKALSIMTQNNYKLNEENQLLFVSGGRDIILFTQQNTGEGSYPVTDAVFAEDGEGYAASIKAMCEEIGEEYDEFLDDLAFSDAMVINELKQYLDEYPEIAGIEYDGEIRTSEDLYELWNAKLTELYGEPDEELMTEGMTEDLMME